MVGNRSNRPVISTYAVGDFDKDRSPPRSRKSHQPPWSLVGTVGTVSVVAIVAVGGASMFLWPQKASEVETTEAKRLDLGVRPSQVDLTYADNDGEAASPAAIPAFSITRGQPEPGKSDPRSNLPFVGVVAQQTGTERDSVGSRTRPPSSNRRKLTTPPTSMPVLADPSCGPTCLPVPESEGFIAEFSGETIAEPPEEIGTDATMSVAPVQRSELIADAVVGELVTSGAGMDEIALGEATQLKENFAESNLPLGVAEDGFGQLASSASAPAKEDIGTALVADFQVPAAMPSAIAPARVAAPAATEDDPSLVRRDIERRIRNVGERYEVPTATDDVASPDRQTVLGELQTHLADLYERPATVSARGTELGTSNVLIQDDQLVAVKLSELISLFEDQLGRSLFVWLSSAEAASKYVTPESLAAAGIETTFDPQTRQIVLSAVGD